MQLEPSLKRRRKNFRVVRKKRKMKRAVLMLLLRINREE
jgi:hypothetical protein